MHSGHEQLKDWMQRRGFDQAGAGRFLAIDPAEMSKFLSGKRTPGLRTAIRIERLTGIAVEAWTSTEVDDIDQPVRATAKSAR